jgi:hypothetical protein
MSAGDIRRWRSTVASQSAFEGLERLDFDGGVSWEEEAGIDPTENLRQRSVEFEEYRPRNSLHSSPMSHVTCINRWMPLLAYPSTLFESDLHLTGDIRVPCIRVFRGLSQFLARLIVTTLLSETSVLLTRCYRRLLPSSSATSETNGQGIKPAQVKLEESAMPRYFCLDTQLSNILLRFYCGVNDLRFWQIPK